MPKKVDANGYQIFEGGSGRKEGQKLKPYLVMQCLLKKTDESHVLAAEDIISYLQGTCGIDAERRSIYRDIKEINKAGTTVLLVEQNAKKALSIANRAYVLETGNIVLEGDAKELMQNDRVKKAYLGE